MTEEDKKKTAELANKCCDLCESLIESLKNGEVRHKEREAYLEELHKKQRKQLEEIMWQHVKKEDITLYRWTTSPWHDDLGFECDDRDYQYIFGFENGKPTLLEKIPIEEAYKDVDFEKHE